jgi:hypothetical protein
MDGHEENLADAMQQCPCTPPMKSWRRPPLKGWLTITWLSGVVHFSFPFLVHYRIPDDTGGDRQEL